MRQRPFRSERETINQTPLNKDRMTHILQFLARFWFPMALGVLFLLAVPGLILMVLNLVGADGPVNDWLEENFQLSYHLALSGPLSLILLLVIPAIILLYFLKLKPKPL